MSLISSFKRSSSANNSVYKDEMYFIKSALTKAGNELQDVDERYISTDTVRCKKLANSSFDVS